MANVRASLGAILGTITSAASAVTGTLDIVTHGVQMLNSRVDAETAKQAVTLKLELTDHKSVALSEAAIAASDRRVKLKAYALKSKDHAQFLQEEHDRLSKLLDDVE